MPYENFGTANIETFNDVAGNQYNKYVNTTAAKDFLRPFAATDAAWDSSARSPADICCEGTRLQVLSDVIQFLEDPQHKDKIYWLYGALGVGKSAVAQSLATRCRDKDILGAGFFFSQDDVNRNDARKLFTTIAYQLCRASKHQDKRSRKVLEKDLGIVDRKPSEQLQRLLRDVIPDGFRRTVVIIDALDEGGADEILEEILPLVLHASRFTPLRFVITSQKTPIIQNFLQDNSHIETIDLFSYDADNDIHRFYVTRFAQLSEKRQIKNVWFNDNEIMHLVASTGGLFIYAAAVVKYVSSGRQKSPRRRLEDVLKIHTQQFPEVYQRLDALYRQILSQIPQRDYDVLTRKVISAVCLAAYPLPPHALDNLLGLDPGDAWQCLQDLHAFFQVPNESEKTACVRLVHRFFRGFIFDATRSKQYAVDIHQAHADLSDRCLDTLMSCLKRNICDLAPSGTLTHSESQAIVRDKCNERLSAAVEYASRFWYHHLRSAEVTKASLASLRPFVGPSILHWVEAMSLLRRLHETIAVFRGVSQYIQELEASALVKRFEDVWSIVQDNFAKIVDWPLNVYHLGIDEGVVVDPNLTQRPEEATEPPSITPLNSPPPGVRPAPPNPLASSNPQVPSGSSVGGPVQLDPLVYSYPESPLTPDPCPSLHYPTASSDSLPSKSSSNLLLASTYESTNDPALIMDVVDDSPANEDIEIAGRAIAELGPEFQPNTLKAEDGPSSSPPLSILIPENAASPLPVQPTASPGLIEGKPSVTFAQPIVCRTSYANNAPKSPSGWGQTLSARGSPSLRDLPTKVPDNDYASPTRLSPTISSRKNPPPRPPRLTTTDIPAPSQPKLWNSSPKHYKFGSMRTEPSSATALREMFLLDRGL